MIRDKFKAHCRGGVKPGLKKTSEDPLEYSQGTKDRAREAVENKDAAKKGARNESAMKEAAENAVPKDETPKKEVAENQAKSGSESSATFVSSTIDSKAAKEKQKVVKYVHPADKHPWKPKWSTYYMDKDDIEHPWFHRTDHREKWQTMIPMMGIIAGLVVGCVFMYDGAASVTQFKYCPVLREDFSLGLNDQMWTKEVEVGGFGNGQFEQTTDTDENVWVQDGSLFIRPTLQDENLVENDIILDLRDQGCTGTNWRDCVHSTNTTNGTIIQPVKSARINTKRGANIKYGRVEVVAKLPAGDWLWPAIWMLPIDKVYGEWPRSGEIDIAASRGNNFTYPTGGNNIINSALHFGPNSHTDGWWRNVKKRTALHTTYADEFNTFGLEWTNKYLFTYLETRLLQVFYTSYPESFYSYGRFPLAENHTRILNPWRHTGSNVSPFDQDFYLVLSVAVGGTNGWFADGKAGKPWVDDTWSAKRDFWEARDEWWPTWREKGFMQVKSVKMWQQAGWKGCTEKTGKRIAPWDT